MNNKVLRWIIFILLLMNLMTAYGIIFGAFTWLVLEDGKPTNGIEVLPIIGIYLIYNGPRIIRSLYNKIIKN